MPIPRPKAHHWAAQDMRQCQLRQLHRHRRDEDPKRLIGGWPHEAWIPPDLRNEPKFVAVVVAVVVVVVVVAVVVVLFVVVGGGGGGSGLVPGRFCDIYIYIYYHCLV